MKKYILILSLAGSLSASAQTVSLRECVEKGLENKDNVRSGRVDLTIAELKRIDARSKYIPQISISYDYRYFPIIASQILPVGQFLPVPSGEKRVIKFGTNWQQDVGLTLYQPLLDRVIKSRIKEAELNKQISAADLSKAENDLMIEVIKSYSKVLTIQFDLRERIADTTRSSLSLLLVKKKWEEGKLLKTELNNALVNHNSNLSGYRSALSRLFNEKVYLQFLTGIELGRLLESEWSPIPASLYRLNTRDSSIYWDDLPEYQVLKLQEKLLIQQMVTEKSKRSPTLGLKGFIGASQFTDKFDPFMSNSWFGSSYVGLSVRFPILSPDNSINGKKQLEQQVEKNGLRKTELRSEKNKDYSQLENKIRETEDEMMRLQQSLGLLQENILIYQNRLKDGQLAAIELNIQEIEVQKISSQIIRLREELNLALVEQLNVSGRINPKRLLSLLGS